MSPFRTYRLTDLQIERVLNLLHRETLRLAQHNSSLKEKDLARRYRDIHTSIARQARKQPEVLDNSSLPLADQLRSL